jgi:hypothetical protein
MGFMAKKYKFLARFCHEQAFLVKPKANTFGFLGQNLILVKTNTNLCTRPQHLTVL